MWAAAIVLCSMLVLAACSKSQHKEGASATVPSTGTTLGETLPSDLPPYAAVYPGADVQSVVNHMGTPGLDGMITYAVAADLPAVEAFHKKAAEKSGLAVVASENLGTGRHFRAEKGTRNVDLSITPDQQHGTSVQMTWK